MGKTKLRQFPPCPVFDTEGIESWLSDMAKEGWLFTDINRFWGYFIFQKDLPQTIHYRLEAVSKHPRFWEDVPNAPTEEAQALYEEMGWHFLLRHQEFDIYKSTAPTPRELHTDPEIQSLTLKMLNKRLWKGLFHLFIQLLFQVTLGVFAFPFGIILTLGSFFFLSFAVLTFYAISSQIRAIFRIRSLRQRLLHGDALNRSKNWHIGARWHRTVQLLLLGLSFLLFFYIIAANCNSAPPLADYTGDIPFVTIEELDPDGVSGRLELINNATCRVWTDPLYPVAFDYLSGGNLSKGDGTGTGGLLEVQYCEASSPWLAMGAAKDFTRFYRNSFHLYQTVGEIRPLPELGLDYAVGFYNQFGLIRVVLAEDNTALCARFSMDDGGKYTIEYWLEQMVQQLKTAS